MKRLIIDYKKLTPEILELLNERYPDGYSDNDIITFDDKHNQTIEAVEVRTEDCIYLVKLSCRLRYTMIDFNASEDVTDDNDDADDNDETVDYSSLENRKFSNEEE